MMNRLAPALLLACSACWGTATYVKGDLTTNDRSAFQPRETPLVIACVVEDNDIGAKVADALQQCGYEVSRILLAADVIPSHPAWANGMRQLRGELPPLEAILVSRNAGNDWGPWVIGELRDENPVFGRVEWVATVRLACGRMPVSPEDKGPRVAQLDVDAFDVRTSQRVFSFRSQYHVQRGGALGKDWNYGSDATLRDECMAPLVDDFLKQLSEATPKR